MACPRLKPLSPIPEIRIECEATKTSEEALHRRDTASTEDEGYGSEAQKPDIDLMLDSLAEMSRRLSLAPSEGLGIDEALDTSMHSDASLDNVLRDERPDIAGGLDDFWRTVRQELSALRHSRDEARADSVMLLEEVSKKACEIDERDAKIKKLKAELSSERKAGKQLQEAMEDLLAWVDAHRSAEPAVSYLPENPIREEQVHRIRQRTDDIPTYEVAFRSRSANTVTVWKVQVVQSYESKTGKPVYFHGRDLPRTLNSYVKFLQFWCSDRFPQSGGSAVCLWCQDRGLATVWHAGFEAQRPCRECASRGRHCFAVASGVLKCLPIRDIGAFLEGGT